MHTLWFHFIVVWMLNLRATGARFNSHPLIVENDPQKAMYTHVPLSPISITCYRFNFVVFLFFFCILCYHLSVKNEVHWMAVMLWGRTADWQKFMAANHQVLWLALSVSWMHIDKSQLHPQCSFVCIRFMHWLWSLQQGSSSYLWPLNRWWFDLIKLTCNPFWPNGQRKLTAASYSSSPGNRAHCNEDRNYHQYSVHHTHRGLARLSGLDKYCDCRLHKIYQSYY